MKRNQHSALTKKREPSTTRRAKLRVSAQLSTKQQVSGCRSTKRLPQATGRMKKLMLTQTVTKLKQRQVIQAPLLYKLVSRKRPIQKKVPAHTLRSSKQTSSCLSPPDDRACVQLTQQLIDGVHSLRQMIVSPKRPQRELESAAIKIQRWIRKVLAVPQRKQEESVAEIVQSELVDQFKRILRQESAEYSQLKRCRKPAWAVMSAPQQFVTVHRAAEPVHIPVLDLQRVERSLSSADEAVFAKETISSGSELPPVSDIEPSSDRISENLDWLVRGKTPTSFVSSSSEEVDLPKALLSEVMAQDQIESFGPEQVAMLKKSINPDCHPVMDDRIDFLCTYLAARLDQCPDSPRDSFKARLQAELSELLSEHAHLI